MKWNDLTMKERSDLMSLFLKAGVGSLSDMKHIYDGTRDVKSSKTRQPASSIAGRALGWVTDKLGLTASPTYEDGYGASRNIEVPFKESAQGQELNRIGETAKTAGNIALMGAGMINPLTAGSTLGAVLGTVGQGYGLTLGMQNIFNTAKKAINKPYSVSIPEYTFAALDALPFMSGIKTATSGISKGVNFITDRITGKQFKEVQDRVGQVFGYESPEYMQTLKTKANLTFNPFRRGGSVEAYDPDINTITYTPFSSRSSLAHEFGHSIGNSLENKGLGKLFDDGTYKYAGKSVRDLDIDDVEKVSRELYADSVRQLLFPYKGFDRELRQRAKAADVYLNSGMYDFNSWFSPGLNVDNTIKQLQDSYRIQRLNGLGNDIFRFNTKAPYSEYPRINLIRNMNGLPTEHSFGKVYPSNPKYAFTNNTTDIPFRLHGSYPYMPGPDYQIINLEAFKGRSPLSIKPMDTIFENVPIEKKFIDILSGNKETLGKAILEGYGIYTTPKLLAEYENINKTIPRSTGKLSLVKTDFGRQNTENYRKEVDSIFSALGRPTKKDYAKLAKDTGFKLEADIDNIDNKDGFNKLIKIVNDYKTTLNSHNLDLGFPYTFPGGDRTVTPFNIITDRHGFDIDMFKNVVYDPAPPIEVKILRGFTGNPMTSGHPERGIYSYEDLVNFVGSKPIKKLGGYLHKYPNGGELKPATIIEKIGRKWDNLYWQKFREPKDFSDEVASTPECAAWSNKELRKKGYNIWGDAWTRSSQRVKKVFSGYDGLDRPKDYSYGKYRDYIFDAADNVKDNFNWRDLKENDIVGMYFRGSPNYQKAFLNGTNGEAQTHTGHVVYRKGKPYVAHNVHGDIKLNKAKKVIGRKHPYGIVSIYRPYDLGGYLTF